MIPEEQKEFEEASVLLGGGPVKEINLSDRIEGARLVAACEAYMKKIN